MQKSNVSNFQAFLCVAATVMLMIWAATYMWQYWFIMSSIAVVVVSAAVLSNLKPLEKDPMAWLYVPLDNFRSSVALWYVENIKPWFTKA